MAEDAFFGIGAMVADAELLSDDVDEGLGVESNHAVLEHLRMPCVAEVSSALDDVAEKGEGGMADVGIVVLDCQRGG